MTHEHLGLNLTPPPSQTQGDHRADHSSGTLGRRPAHQRTDHLPSRPPPTVRSREPLAPDINLLQDTSLTNQEMATRLKEQEEEIQQLRAEVAAAHQHWQQRQQQHQQPQQQPLPPPNPPQPMADQQQIQTGGQDPLFTNEAAIERARALAAAKDESKKTQLLDLIPGFKANALDIGESSITSPSTTIVALCNHTHHPPSPPPTSTLQSDPQVRGEYQASRAHGMQSDRPARHSLLAKGHTLFTG
ncbi:hypothetical protein JB92DRAFT_3118905 [Gautieria morchelliformis]|nr:hypothetical protein JB92DRAFT_3118905 [Gautieria morchelliformis]